MNWSEEIFVIKKVKNNVISGLTVKKYLERFAKKHCKKIIENCLELRNKKR